MGTFWHKKNRSWLKWNREREPRLQPEQGPVETRRNGIVVHTKTVKTQFP